MKFICPKCKLPFVRTDAHGAVCGAGHSFDRAREGYFNLLLSNTRAAHGDNAEMVVARRNFLNTGAYLPLAEAVCAAALRYMDGESLLDIGCGEGYYTERLARSFADAGRSLSVSAFDISRDAARRAARRVPSAVVSVASAYHMPIADSSFDMAVNMFSPLALEETQRVLRSGGIFIMAIPGARHLFGLKEATYSTPYENEVADKTLSGFELIDEDHLLYGISLESNAEVRDLFMMTPYAYRTRPEDKERVLALPSLETSAEFHVLVYKRL